MTTSGSLGKELPLAARLQATTTALHELEQAVKSGDLDARVLGELRNAIDHIRYTALAVQDWFGAQERSGDPYAVLSTLAAQRVRRATQLAKDLTLDLQNVDVGLETEGLADLYDAVSDLHRHLQRLFKRGT
jgi:hypothetical protein